MASSRAWATVAIGIAGFAAFVQCTGEDPDTTGSPADGGLGTTDAPIGADAGDSGAGDGASTGDADAEPEARRCDPTKPFGSIEVVPLNDAGTLNQIVGGRLSPDELHLYFSSLGPGGGAGQIREAVRADASAPFVSHQLMNELNTNDNDDRPTLTTNLQNVVFDTNRNDAGSNPRLWRAQRTVVPGPFSAPEEIPTGGVNVLTERDPYLVDDGKVMYWTSSRENNPPRVFRAVGATPFAWGSVAAVTELNFADAEGDSNYAPVVTPDELVVYFTHGPVTFQSNAEIWRASRASAGSTLFGTPQKVTELAHPAFDAPTWISPDDCVIYFVSTRGADGMGDPSSPTNIFSARRPP